MCGICGTVGSPRADVVEAMLNLLKHRGPDDEGTYASPYAVIGARRLAIIDVEHGRQPALNEDGDVAAVLNGEIYNYRELRALLERRGHRLRSHADTEVLPHLYEEYGAELTALVRGMFALAIWDEREQRLVVARDRAGEKPLLYAELPSGLVFASELKAVLAHPDVDGELDPVALRLYLALQYVPGPRTMIAGVSKLPAGHRLVVEGGAARVERYWDAVPGEPAHLRSRRGAAQELRQILQEAVAVQLHADVPVGALLSGGLDSTAVVALMSEAAPEPPRTFTVGFADAAFDERPQAREAARALGTEHTELLVEPPTFDDLERVVWHLDEPVADQAALPTFLISRVASEHVKVVLTGEGSDELFGGYPRYRWLRRAEAIDRVPARVRAPVRRLLSAAGTARGRELDLLLTPRSPLERHVAWVGVFGGAAGALLAPGTAANADDEAVRHLARVEAEWADRCVVERSMYVDFKTWLVDDILTKADRMTMAASLEGRAPFLDQHVVEFAFSLPAAARVGGRQTKALLREALADVLPAAALARRKHAFQVPVDRWLRTRFAEPIRDMLLARDSRTLSLLRPGAVEGLFAAEGREPARRLWTLAVLELWLRLVQEEAQGARSAAGVGRA